MLPQGEEIRISGGLIVKFIKRDARYDNGL
jgi:hypothetical protein